MEYRAHLSGGDSITELQAAAETLVSSIRKHLCEVEKFSELNAAQVSLARASTAFIEALREYKDAGVKNLRDGLRGASGEVEDSVSTASDEPDRLFSILSRIDYRVESFNVLIEEGRHSYLKIAPNAPEDEVESEVGDVASALYEILHANDDRVPFPFPGATPIAGITWFVPIRQAMSTELGDRPQRPFSVAEDAEQDLLYFHRDIFVSPIEIDE